MNILFEYLYRDGANYKEWGNIVFSNPEQLPVVEIDKRLRQAFEPDSLFIADQVDVPEVFLFRDGDLTANDHCYHEYDHVEVSDKPVTDVYDRTVNEFLLQVEDASRTGWKAFNLCDWLILKKMDPRIKSGITS